MVRAWPPELERGGNGAPDAEVTWPPRTSTVTKMRPEYI